MKLKAKCPSCYSVLVLDQSEADKRKRCFHCGRMFKVPDPETMEEAMNVLKTARVSVYLDEEGNTYA